GGGDLGPVDEGVQGRAVRVPAGDPGAAGRRRGPAGVHSVARRGVEGGGRTLGAAPRRVLARPAAAGRGEVKRRNAASGEVAALRRRVDSPAGRPDNLPIPVRVSLVVGPPAPSRSSFNTG